MTLSIVQSLEITLSAAKMGQWDEAHSIVASIKHPLAYEIHAHLHRKTDATALLKMRPGSLPQSF